MPHSQTLLLLLSQSCACVGAIMYHTLDFSHVWTQCLQFILLLCGVYASRINSAIIAIILVLLAKGKSQLVSRLQPYLLAIGVIAPACFVGIVFAATPELQQVNGGKADPNFQLGQTQAIVSLAVLNMSLFLVMLSMILSQRKYKKEKLSYLSNISSNGSSGPSNSTTPTQLSPPMCGYDTENSNDENNSKIAKPNNRYSDEMLRSVGLTPGKDVAEEDCCNWKDSSVKGKNERDCQMIRHTVLLLFIAISMAVGW